MQTKKKLLCFSFIIAGFLAFVSPSFSEGSSLSFSDSGTASWFGRWHHGKKTASGELFDMYAMTAAHRTLPFGTVLQVINVETGLDILVRVNDRGPYRKRRILDLSFAAAESLGMRREGVAKVEIMTVGDASGMPLDDSQAFFVRLDPENNAKDRAEEKLAGLIRMGFPRAADLLHRAGGVVALGPFECFQEAQEALMRVSTIHPKAAIILASKEKAQPVASTHALR